MHLSIDGRDVAVSPDTTIYDAARGIGIDIPTLCHAQHMSPVGVCRVCTVAVKGARVLAAACIRPVEAGMTVDTTSDAVRARAPNRAGITSRRSSEPVRSSALHGGLRTGGARCP